MVHVWPCGSLLPVSDTALEPGAGRAVRHRQRPGLPNCRVRVGRRLDDRAPCRVCPRESRPSSRTRVLARCAVGAEHPVIRVGHHGLHLRSPCPPAVASMRVWITYGCGCVAAMISVKVAHCVVSWKLRVKSTVRALGQHAPGNVHGQIVLPVIGVGWRGAAGWASRRLGLRHRSRPAPAASRGCIPLGHLSRRPMPARTIEHLIVVLADIDGRLPHSPALSHRGVPSRAYCLSRPAASRRDWPIQALART